MDKLVDVFIGGVQKAGTTALFEYLCAHPSIAGPIKKETHFFDKEEIDWTAPDYRSFHAKFFAGAASNKLWVDATPIYCFWPPSLARIKAYNKDARLIFSFRDPIERAYSHWRMECRRQADTVDFQTAVTSGRDRLERAAPLTEPHRVFSYVERGFYGEQVRRILSLFPREQVLFLSAQGLRGDHKGSLAAVWRFLDLDPADLAPIVAHADSVDAMTVLEETRGIDRLKALYRRDLGDFADLTGLDVSNWLTMR